MIRAILILSMVLIAIPAYAGWGIDECLSEWGVSCYGMRISICPQGDFESIRDGCGTGNDYIWVHVVDEDGNGYAGVPCTDYWLRAVDPAEELYLCANTIVADSITNSSGRTTISGPILGGGCAATGGLWLAVQGNIIRDMPHCNVHIEHIVIVSVDLSADGHVNISDFVVFAFGYNKHLGDQDYNKCCDYNHDDECNISDFAFFAFHYQHECF